MNKNKQVRVLVAAAQVSVTAISEALSNEFDTDFVATLAEAEAYSYEQADVIVCGLYFDESRMFDLLRYAQLHPTARTLPFFCVSAVENALSSTIRQGIEIACRALGGTTFIDLNRWTDEYGAAHARARIRQLIRQAATSKHDC